MMSDDMLSQDEIDALLKGTADDQVDPEPESIKVEDYMDAMEIDTLGEIGNISFGSSATALSALLGQKVDITTPTVSIVKANEVSATFPHPSVAINVEYTAGLEGANLLVIKQQDSAIIADLMLGGDGLNAAPQLDEIQLSAVQEAMNQMMGSAATSMSTIFNSKVDISPPAVELLDLEKGQTVKGLADEELLVQISFNLQVGTLIDSNIMQLIPLVFAKKLVNRLVNGEEPSVQEAAPSAIQEAPAPVKEEARPVHQEQPVNRVAEQPAYHEPAPEIQLNRERQAQPVNVQPAQFSSFEQSGLNAGESRNLNLLLDIPLQVTVELGRTKRSVKEILEMTSGSVIELDKLAGEPVDILVNSRLIAKGEVVVIDENFGVRLTDIVSQTDRLSKLR